ncbi:zinc finger domain protein [Cutibacterium avidum ATCC 25577]|uniref:Zinc finger domain protein n=2 Tax=Cutibacterium avidum TaxID=33010 RepID=G4CYC2_9ACTN|nr:zinc finger domain protein [Cutibacterium avidum ATCC 25577]
MDVSKRNPREAATSGGTDRERSSDMTKHTCTTRDGAIQREIIEPIEASGVIGDDDEGYVYTVEHNDFGPRCGTT